MSDLGDRLRAIRAEIVASGERLLDIDEIYTCQSCADLRARLERAVEALQAQEDAERAFGIYTASKPMALALAEIAVEKRRDVLAVETAAVIGEGEEGREGL